MSLVHLVNNNGRLTVSNTKDIHIDATPVGAPEAYVLPMKAIAELSVFSVADARHGVYVSDLIIEQRWQPKGTDAFTYTLNNTGIRLITDMPLAILAVQYYKQK